MKRLMNSIVIEHKKTIFDLKQMKEVEVVGRVTEINTLIGLVHYIVKNEGFYEDGLTRDKFVDICVNIERFFEDDLRDFSELDIQIGNDNYNEIIELIKEDLE